MSITRPIVVVSSAVWIPNASRGTVQRYLGSARLRHRGFKTYSPCRHYTRWKSLPACNRASVLAILIHPGAEQQNPPISLQRLVHHLDRDAHLLLRPSQQRRSHLLCEKGIDLVSHGHTRLVQRAVGRVLCGVAVGHGDGGHWRDWSRGCSDGSGRDGMDGDGVHSRLVDGYHCRRRRFTKDSNNTRAWLTVYVW